MPDESTTNVEVRLERLFALRASGGLDDAEFAAAKAAILSSAAGGSGGPDPRVPPPYATVDEPAPTVVRFGHALLVFLGTMLGMVIACLGSVFLGLQGPAGRFMCGSTPFVAGRVVERAGSETTYNFDSACLLPDGSLERVSQFKLFVVLWLIYLPVGLLVAYLVGWMIKRRVLPIAIG